MVFYYHMQPVFEKQTGTNAFALGDVFCVGDQERPTLFSCIRDFRNVLIMAPTAAW